MYRFRVSEELTLCIPSVPLVEFFTAVHCWEIETRRPKRLSGSHFQPGNDQNYDRKLKYQFPYEIQGREFRNQYFFTIIIAIVAIRSSFQTLANFFIWGWSILSVAGGNARRNRDFSQSTSKIWKYISCSSGVLFAGLLFGFGFAFCSLSSLLLQVLKDVLNTCFMSALMTVGSKREITITPLS